MLDTREGVYDGRSNDSRRDDARYRGGGVRRFYAGGCGEYDTVQGEGKARGCGRFRENAKSRFTESVWSVCE